MGMTNVPGLLPVLVVMAAVAAAPAVVAQEKPAPLIAEACFGCHGPGAAGQGGVPGLRGYNQAEFIKTWSAFRANERSATIMNRIARGYTDEEIATLADYFSNLK